MVTLTGTFTRLDGTPASGTVRVTPSRSPILDSDGKIVISGPQVFPLDKDGKLTTEIPASNDPDLGPAFTYSVDVNLAHASWKISKVWIPHGSSTVDLSEIGDYTPVPGVATRVVTVPADGADGQVLVWDGAGFTWAHPPKGDQGDQGDPGTSDIVVDTSVGTRVYANGVMVYGDTGWRTITGHEGKNASIRRVGNLVFLSTSWAPFPGSALSQAVTVPAGFRVSGITRLTYATSSGGAPTNLVIVRSNGNIDLYTKNDGGFYADVSWTTDNPWPTTLPGTPL